MAKKTFRDLKDLADYIDKQGKAVGHGEKMAHYRYIANVVRGAMLDSKAKSVKGDKEIIDDARVALTKLSRDKICDIRACQNEFFNWKLPTANPEGRLWTKEELIDRILSAKPRTKLITFLTADNL
jgi:hypothetical protein